MPFQKSSTSKCPICSSRPPDVIERVNSALEDIIDGVRETGEVPKAADPRFVAVAREVQIAPHSLRFHVKTCLIPLEIRDQRGIELADLASALATAKSEYQNFPSIRTAKPYSDLLNNFRELSKDVEGQDDPEVAVEYMASRVIAPITRATLAVFAQEIRDIADSVMGSIPKNREPAVRARFESAFKNTAAGLSIAMDEALKAACEFYKVELDTTTRRRTIDDGTVVPPPEKVVKAKRLRGTA